MPNPISNRYPTAINNLPNKWLIATVTLVALGALALVAILAIGCSDLRHIGELFSSNNDDVATRKSQPPSSPPRNPPKGVERLLDYGNEGELLEAINGGKLDVDKHLERILARAQYHSYVELIFTCAEKVKDVDQNTSENFPLIAYFAQHGYEAATEKLIQRGANTDVHYVTGRTRVPLIKAFIENGWILLLRKLPPSQLSEDIPYSYVDATFTPFEYALDKAKHESKDEVKYKSILIELIRLNAKMTYQSLCNKPLTQHLKEQDLTGALEALETRLETADLQTLIRCYEIDRYKAKVQSPEQVELDAAVETDQCELIKYIIEQKPTLNIKKALVHGFSKLDYPLITACKNIAEKTGISFTQQELDEALQVRNYDFAAFIIEKSPHLNSSAAIFHSIDGVHYFLLKACFDANPDFIKATKDDQSPIEYMITSFSNNSHLETGFSYKNGKRAWHAMDRSGMRFNNPVFDIICFFESKFPTEYQKAVDDQYRSELFTPDPDIFSSE